MRSSADPAQIEARLAEVGVDVGRGAIRLLTMPRVFGFVFNPISLYYCHHEDGRLAAMVYEVTSTFGERRSYVLPVLAADAQAEVVGRADRRGAPSYESLVGGAQQSPRRITGILTIRRDGTGELNGEGDW